MTLAQEPTFKARTPTRKRLAWDIPTRSVIQAEEASKKLRKDFKKMNKSEREKLIELLQATIRTMIHLMKDRRVFSKRERTDFAKTATIYQNLKSELLREMR